MGWQKRGWEGGGGGLEVAGGGGGGGAVGKLGQDKTDITLRTSHTNPTRSIHANTGHIDEQQIHVPYCAESSHSISYPSGTRDKHGRQQGTPLQEQRMAVPAATRDKVKGTVESGRHRDNVM